MVLTEMYRCIPPWRIDTRAATEAVERNGKTKVLELEHARVCEIDI